METDQELEVVPLTRLHALFAVLQIDIERLPVAGLRGAIGARFPLRHNRPMAMSRPLCGQSAKI